DADASLSVLYYLTPTAPPPIYARSLHDALPIFHLQARKVMNPHSTNLQRHYMQADRVLLAVLWGMFVYAVALALWFGNLGQALRSEEHTSELQSRENLVCRLLLEKKKPER